MRICKWRLGAAIAVALVAIITTTYFLISGRSEDTNMRINKTDSMQLEYYKNPIAKQGDFADPFILKYNGRYYLYCTNRDVKCWSSANLTDWKPEGTVIAPGQLEGLVPFAPEVVYWNGAFYMYTSPSGLGHYILKSDSPTGPFLLQTENIGYQIDGSVFIDDDGKWYFYHADDTGIKTCSMPDPITIGSEISTEEYMDGWTEGPYVIKRDGRFYLTYTGNHYLSNGYRINYAMSENSPVKGFVSSSKNPFVINTEGEGVGLGHSMSLIGPDLVSWFIVYHNLNLDASRDLNIDRLAWNGEKMEVLGPTVTKQEAPGMPDFREDFLGTAPQDQWTDKSGTFTLREGYYQVQTLGHDSKSITVTRFCSGADYTAEFNMKAPAMNGKNLRFGAVVSYKDEQNFAQVLLNPAENSVEAELTVKGQVVQRKSASLPEGYDYTKLHRIFVEKQQDAMKITVDGMQRLMMDMSGLAAGNIGLISEAAGVEFGFTALTNSVEEDTVCSTFKPVPGALEAVHYNKGGEGRGYHSASHPKAVSGLRTDGIRVEACSEGGFHTSLKEKGEWFAYRINVAETAAYNMDLRVADVKPGTRVRLAFNGQIITKDQSLTTEENREWQTVSMKGLSMPEGPGVLQIELLSGGFKLSAMDFYKECLEPAVFDASFDSELGSWSYVTGLGRDYILKDGILQLGPYGKIAAGDSNWNDYTVEAEIRGVSAIHSGIIFRVTNPAEGGEGADCMLGANFYRGYYASLTSEGLLLVKQNYDRQELALVKGSYQADKMYHMKVAVKGNEIRVFVDDMNTPKIVYMDQYPYTHGKAGLKTEGAVAVFDNFSVTSK